MAEEKAVRITMADIKKAIDDRVTAVVGTVKTDKPEEKPPTEGKSVADQVSEALARIRSKEARDEKAKTMEEELAALKEKTKEKEPVQRTKRHRFMGWGD